MVVTSWLSGFWNTSPTRRRISSVCASSRVSMPSTSTWPAVGSSRALRCLASVDLPEPLCPTIARNSPSAMVSDTPESTPGASAARAPSSAAS